MRRAIAGGEGTLGVEVALALGGEGGFAERRRGRVWWRSVRGGETAARPAGRAGGWETRRRTQHSRR